MRLIPALLLATALASPALAQDAPAAPAEPAPAAPAEPAPAPAEPAAPAPVELPAAADIGPNVDRDFWCAVAFSLTARSADMSGDSARAAQEAQNSQYVFAAVVQVMQAGNYQEAQFNGLTEQYTAKVLDPFAPPEGRYTREQCDTAATEARAAIEAAQAAPTPDAPAADAPAADAPGTTEAPAAPEAPATPQ